MNTIVKFGQVRVCGGGSRDSQVLALVVIPVPVVDDTACILNAQIAFGSWVNERLSHSCLAHAIRNQVGGLGSDGGLANLGAIANSIGCLSVLVGGKTK